MKLQQQKTEWIAEKLRQYAHVKQIKMYNVAHELGISPQYLSAILNGKKSVSDNFINKIQQLVDDNFNQLDELNEPPPDNYATLSTEYINELRADKEHLRGLVDDLREILKNVTK